VPVLPANLSTRAFVFPGDASRPWDPGSVDPGRLWIRKVQRSRGQVSSLCA